MKVPALLLLPLLVLPACKDDAPASDSAAGLVRKLRFLDKLEADIGDALEALLF